MQNPITYIADRIRLENPLHGKKISKTLKSYDEAYYTRANLFFRKYEDLLKNEGKTLDYAVDCYLQMIADINYETVQFVQTGEYTSKSFDEVNERVYGNPVVMEYYQHGILLSQFLWAHHYNILLYFNNIVTKNRDRTSTYLEVGGGHGLYISEALSLIGDKATFSLVDISQTSLDIAKKMICDDKVSYFLSDIFDYDPSQKFDFITMGEVLEHVEEPDKLLEKIHSLLNDGGKLFVTVPTNAPTIDHIFLFRDAGEIRKIIWEAGFEIEDEICFYSEDVPAEIAEKFKISVMYVGVLTKQEGLNMERDKLLNDIQVIMEEVFDVTSLVISESTTAVDIEEWDSLNHIQLVVAIEKHFNIKFTAQEIRSWVNVGEMCLSVENRLR